ncbi:MAG: strawberry notch C-terminal domain-containing protein [Cyanobacteria bacterium J06642_9]
MIHPVLVEYFVGCFLNGEQFFSIVQARSQAARILGQPVKPGSAEAKQVDEAVEAAVVRTARVLVTSAQTHEDAYDQLVDLLDRQPGLNVRSSTSVLQQAYSTPVPIAFLASALAGIDAQTSVYEPSAGHGALLIAANPARVTANEINPDRAADLRAQGYTVTQLDAANYCPDRKHDVVIANPPFGRIRGPDGKPRRFELPGNRRGTAQIDQAIALQSLNAMKDDGRAVLILGSQLGDEDALRSDRYNQLTSRGFFKVLYERYAVVEHFSISGDLYRKQGAGFPIDMIVINGRGTSQRPLPAAEVPPLYTSFADLKERLLHELNPTQSTDLPGIQQLSLSLETPTDGRPNPVSRASPPRSATDELAALPNPDAAQSSVDDLQRSRTPNSDSATVGDRPRHAQPQPGTAQPIRNQQQSGTSSPQSLGHDLGRSANQAQRHLENEVRDRKRSHNLSLSSQSSPRSPDSAAVAGRSRRDGVGELAGRSDLWHGRVNEEASAMQTPVQPLHVPYLPRSQGRSPKTLIPTNMAAAAQSALTQLERQRGDIDEFVCQRLGFDTKAQLWEVLYAEQIDALALAFHQRDQGKIFLNGDQTGNGKGRFGAANILDAQRQGYIPVFVTQKPNLYNSMINDLADIGRRGFRPFVTNNNLTLKLDSGRKLKTLSALDQEAEMLRIMQQGLDSYDAIFTTYNQLQTLKGKEPFRRQFLSAIAPQAVFIFDESHEAGGSTGENAWKRAGAAPDRAEFVRQLVDTAAGAVFMSATATKDPAVMDLYARRTDARHAVAMNTLKRVLKSGGIPLQQMMATKFVASGQLLRRERSFENITFQAQVVPVDRMVADGISAIMRAINAFDQAKEKAVSELSKDLKKEAKRFSQDNAIGQAGAKSTNFTSLMHNAIDQGLLAQKAEATVQAAIASLQNGEKPLIAVASTMDAFINWYTEENGIEPGDALQITFGDVLARYLERSRDVLISNYEGSINRQRLTDTEIGPDGVATYQAAQDLIADTDLSAIPLSAIDYLKWRLQQSGYSVDEITGRQNIVAYSATGETTYARRSSRDTNPQSKVNIVNRFNSGQLDVVILNRSGATGINLHASEQFSDQRPRHMIVTQAERDINQVMQMLGRVNRFGQVVEPKFTLLMSDLPAEKRLGALLSKKMASLNANTTAARDSDLSVSSVGDFMNSIGEEVITEILEADPELEARLSHPSRNLQGSTEIELISRVTGRIPLLSIAEQEDLYGLIESETQALIAQREALGESPLKAQQLDLDARTIARMQVIPDDSEIKSEFTGPVFLEVVDAKVPIKPPTQLQVINTIRGQLELSKVRQLEAHDFDDVRQLAVSQHQQFATDLKSQTDTYRQQIASQKRDAEAVIRLRDRLDRQLTHVITTLEQFPVGTTVQVITPEQSIIYGVVTCMMQKGARGSPAAPTNWRIHILTDQGQPLQIPLSRFNTDRSSALSVRPEIQNWRGESIYDAFDLHQAEQRTTRQIFTGNILKAYEKYPQGKFLNYTDHQGNVRQGLIMPASFDIQDELRQEPVAFHEPDQAIAFLTDISKYQGTVKDLEQVLTIRSQKAMRFGQGDVTGFVLQTPKATSVGGKYFLNEDLLAAIGTDFYSVGDRMEAIVPAEKVKQVLQVLMVDQHITLAAFDFKEHAREYLGEELPELELIESGEFEQKGNYVPFVPEPTEVDRTRLEGLLANDSKPPVPKTVDLVSQPKRVLPAKQQTGGPEKTIAKLLEQAGLAEAVMQGEAFHCRIENEPFIPLVIERHRDRLYLTHYLTANGDMFIDSEMVFALSEEGRLSLTETAVQSMGGEFRGCDRSFAHLFARNLSHQGFAEAAFAQSTQTVETSTSSTTEVDLATPTEPPDHQDTDGDEQSDVLETQMSHDPKRPEPALPTPSPVQINLKDLANQVREADLEAVAAELGLKQDRYDKHKWKDDSHTHIISINGGKFMDWIADYGSGGAIDLVMHVQQVEFKAAVEWLSGQSLTPRSVYPKESRQPEQIEPRPLEMPTPSERRWPAVQNYLVETRGLPKNLVTYLHDRGMVYADPYQNAVFVRYGVSPDQPWKRHEPTGASLRGTWGAGNSFRGMAPGTSRDKGWFWIALGQGIVQRVFLTESPIDALSLAVLDRKYHRPKAGTVYLSTDGSGAIPTEVLQQVLDRRGGVTAAFDADVAGERMAWRVAEQLPGVRRVTPAVGKDWNERLLAEGCSIKNATADLNKQRLKALWHWYRAAHALGKSPQYLARITVVAREVLGGEPLSARAKAAMVHDRTQARGKGRGRERQF